MSVQATRRPTAAQRASRARSDSRTLARVIAGAVLAQAASWAWYVSQAAAYERSITSLQAQLRQAQDDVRDAQLALSGYQLDEQRRVPHD